MTTVAPKGLVLFLIQASESMSRPVSACGNESGLHLALKLARATIQKMQILATRGLLVAAEWEVAVLSLGSNAYASPRSLLPGTTRTRPTVELAVAPLSNWVSVSASGDAPSPAALLSGAATLAREWLAGRPGSLRPLVVIYLDEEMPDFDLERRSRGLGTLVPPAELASRGVRHLVASAGPAELALCGISPEVATNFPGPSPEASSLPEPWLWYRELVSDWCSPESGKLLALSVNDRSSKGLVQHIHRMSLYRPAVSPGWRFGSANAPRCEGRVLLAPKEGNSDQEWEDGLAVEAERGLVVVADGATQGIFARQWADILTRRWAVNPPDTADVAGFEGWVSEARKEWRTGIDYDNLHGLNQDKVNEIGAGTAILALGLERSAGQHLWRSAAVGDVCLFWVRGGELLMTFPATCSADFGSAPDLVRTLKIPNAGVRIIRAEGVGQLGDLYGLATDAVAQCLLKLHESGTPIDWERLWKMDGQAWREQLGHWRSTRQIVNDDSTLVMLRVID